MADRSLYRAQAVARRDEQESIDALPRVTAPHEWAIVAGLVLLLVAALGWAIFGRIEVRSTVAGALVRPGERSAVVAALPGTITEVLVKPGQAVAAGARIVTVEPVGLDLQIARVTEELWANLLDRAAEPGPTALPATVQAALEASVAQATAARVELISRQAEGSAIVSPRAGVVTALHAAVGDTVQAGALIADLRFDADGPATAVTLVSAQQARAVRPGMTARVLIEQGGEQRALPAEVTTVAASGQLPEWLRQEPFAAAWAHGEARGVLVTLAVAAAPEAFAVDAPWPCRVELVESRIRPLGLLASGRSG